MKIDIRELVSVMGKELAHSDDETQSRLFNLFGYEISVLGERKADAQLCYLSDKLDRNGEEAILTLAEFIKIRRERRI